MKTKFLITLQSAVGALPFLGCTPRPRDGSMGAWGHMMGYGYGGILMWLILIIIAVVIAYFAVTRSRSAGRPEDSTGVSPREILNRRYANGEISKEEFDKLKKDIEG